MKQEEKSPLQIAESLIGHWDHAEGRKILVVAALKGMHDRLTKKVDWLSTTFLGYHFLIKHYDRRPEAVAWTQLMLGAQTLRDLWDYFLKVNNMKMSDVQILNEYDHSFFQDLLSTPIGEFKAFGLNLVECDFTVTINWNNDIMTTDNHNKQEIKDMRAQMERIVQNRGYYIQGVDDPEGMYAYTFGRNDRGLADLIILRFNNVLARLFDEAFALIDLGEEGTGAPFVPGKVYESKYLICSAGSGQATKFKIVPAHAGDHEDKILGTLNRGKALSEVKLLEIVVAGENNTF
jgi:hypothetical protein